jgi:serine/threonine protein phosphatase PrpC
MAQGGYAADLTLSTFVARVLRQGRTSSEERLDQAARSANRVVYSELQGNGGATLTAVLVEATGKATGINVGDSRLYRIIHDEIRQLSRDDTLGEYLRSEHSNAQAVNHRREICSLSV